MIVEDTPAVAELLAEALTILPGVTSTICHDAAQALQVLQEVKADLLVLDVMLPGMSGLELYRHLGDSFQGKVLFITADPESFRQLREQRAGDAVMRKPFDLNNVCATASRLLGLDDE